MDFVNLESKNTTKNIPDMSHAYVINEQAWFKIKQFQAIRELAQVDTRVIGDFVAVTQHQLLDAFTSLRKGSKNKT